MTLLRAQNVSVRLGHAEIVKDASFSLARGELTALVGPNGAGKTTLVRALAGLIASQGNIEIEGRPLAAIPPRERARLMGYLPQGNIFHWPMPVEAIVGLGRYPHGDPFAAPTDADKIAIEEALAATATEKFAQRAVTTLSGGERARVALARVVMRATLGVPPVAVPDQLAALPELLDQDDARELGVIVHGALDQRELDQADPTRCADLRLRLDAVRERHGLPGPNLPQALCSGDQC